MTYKTTIVAQKTKWSVGPTQLQGIGDLLCVFPEVVQAAVTGAV